LSAFVLWLQLAFLENVARSNGEGGWHSVVVLLSTIGYLVALVLWMLRQEPAPLRDGYLIAYCAYIAGLLALVLSGNFLHQVQLYGPLTAVTNHLAALLYVALPVVFSVDRLILLL
jgi:hypothetical protein